MKKILLFLVAAALLGADAAVEVYFLRHGETTWNRAKILQGSIPYTDLTRRGEQMAEATARGMAAAGIAFDRIYTSPYRRARHTAEIIARTNGLPAPADEPRIREMCFGKYEGRRYKKGMYADDNMRSFFEEPDRYVPQGEGAETFAQVGARLRDFLENEVKPLDGKVKRVLCVAHSLVLKTVIREFAGDAAPADAKKTLQRNCCVHVLRYDGGKFSIVETGRIFYSPEDFDAPPGPMVVAHRGAGDLTMPEASLPAYSNAVAMACDIVKLDLQETKDGVAVMSHDNTLKRTMGWSAEIRNLTYAEILEKGRFLDNEKPGNERIVRLEQALAIVKPIPEFWIDFKDSRNFSPAFAEKVLAAFAAAGIDTSRVMMATFNQDALAYFLKKHPDIRRVGHFGLHKTGDDNYEDMQMALALRDKYKLFGINLSAKKGATSLKNVEFLKKNGLWVSLWFIQDTAIADKYRNSGADAFVTDHVSLVRMWN